MCKYFLQEEGDCSGCPASFWLNDGGLRKGYYRTGMFSCRIEEGIMTEQQLCQLIANRENE